MAISSSRKDWIDSIDRNIMPFVEYEGYDNRYPANDIVTLQSYEIEGIRNASRILFSAFQKAVKVCQECDDNFLEEMEIPKKIIPFLHKQNVLNFPTWLSRFDFVVDRFNQLKMVEINADTPCALVEAYYANAIACKHFGKVNPNENSYEELKSFLADIYYKSAPPVDLSTGNFSDENPFIFSCFEDYIEDYGTTLFLKNAMREALNLPPTNDDICFSSFYTLGVDEANQIILPDGRVARGIYRLHPMELLIEEETEEGESLGVNLMEGYLNDKFIMFNPPESIIMQSKGFQALIWKLAEIRSDVFTNEEITTIKRYMLPSYFEEDAEEGLKKNYGTNLWVRKPLWGREGLDISVVDRYNNVKIKKENVNPEDVVRRESESYLWQEFVNQKQIYINTDEGRINGYQTISCFMLGNKPSALYARFSPDAIAGTEAYWLPLGM